MPEPLAYYLTWTTYGSWLPGDERGWVWRGKGFQLPDPQRQARARERMTEAVCILTDEQRRVVEKTIADHCRIRGWHLHVVNCRTNHVHVVVTAPLAPEEVRDQFKAWCTRKLKELQPQGSAGAEKMVDGKGERALDRRRGEFKAVIHYVPPTANERPHQPDGHSEGRPARPRVAAHTSPTRQRGRWHPRRGRGPRCARRASPYFSPEDLREGP